MYVRQNKSQLGIATNRGFSGARRATRRRAGLGQAAPATTTTAEIVVVDTTAPALEPEAQSMLVKAVAVVILGLTLFSVLKA